MYVSECSSVAYASSILALISSPSSLVLQIRSVLCEYEADGSDEVDFQEIVTIVYKLTNGPSEAEIKQGMLEVRYIMKILIVIWHFFTHNHSTFIQYFDDNLDGLISLDELMMAWDKAVAGNSKLVKPDDEEIKVMFNEADLDKDGFLNENEFFAIIDALKESDDEVATAET